MNLFLSSVKHDIISLLLPRPALSWVPNFKFQIWIWILSWWVTTRGTRTQLGSEPELWTERDMTERELSVNYSPGKIRSYHHACCWLDCVLITPSLTLRVRANIVLKSQPDVFLHHIMTTRRYLISTRSISVLICICACLLSASGFCYSRVQTVIEGNPVSCIRHKSSLLLKASHFFLVLFSQSLDFYFSRKECELLLNEAFTSSQSTSLYQKPFVSPKAAASLFERPVS